MALPHTHTHQFSISFFLLGIWWLLHLDTILRVASLGRHPDCNAHVLHYLELHLGGDTHCNVPALQCLARPLGGDIHIRQCTWAAVLGSPPRGRYPYSNVHGLQSLSQPLLGNAHITNIQPGAAPRGRYPYSKVHGLQCLAQALGEDTHVHAVVSMGYNAWCCP